MLVVSHDGTGDRLLCSKITDVQEFPCGREVPGW